MYQINLQNITGKSPGRMIKSSLFKKNFTNSAAQFSRMKNCSTICTAAFFVLIMLLGCEDDSGQVGTRFIDGEDRLVNTSFSFDDIEIEKDPTYSGNLRSFAIGRYDDPLFGTITNIGYVRPSINQQVVDSFDPDTDIMRLRLVVNDQEYGDTTAVANYSVYEIADTWRGNEVEYSDQINFDTSQKLGEFSVNNEDTVFVDLDAGWASRYAEFLNSDSANRDSLYRVEFPGIAIVPDDPEGSKIIFATVLSDDGNNQPSAQNSGFIIEKPDEEIFFQQALDWASTLERTEISGAQEDNIIKVHNTLENFISVDPELTEENLKSQNLARVELVLFENKNLLEQTLPFNHTRPNVESVRIHILDSKINLAEQIFSSNPDFVALRDSADNSFRFNITNLANSELFGTPVEGRFYLTVQLTNGQIFSTAFYDINAVENRRPMITVTAVNTNN